MTLEELKTEASKFGYSLCKKITYEPISRCQCGSMRISRDIDYRCMYYRCTNCGMRGAKAKTKYQAIKNWNKAVKQNDTLST